ncbi:hypothetical protein RRG08_020211 [Elysia crispata]|uniref:Uncharacterized protein n=1 Tax=Elysia crispata TaxID=231223 RepID=A0AAE1DQZ9_9GAST|nr:hypothetical protein RRG08_020211 [Elysia crispata]
MPGDTQGGPGRAREGQWWTCLSPPSKLTHTGDRPGARGCVNWSHRLMFLLEIPQKASSAMTWRMRTS